MGRHVERTMPDAPLTTIRIYEQDLVRLRYVGVHEGLRTYADIVHRMLDAYKTL